MATDMLRQNCHRYLCMYVRMWVYVCTYVRMWVYVCMYVCQQDIYSHACVAIYLGTILGPSWDHFEAILGTFWEPEPPKMVLSLGRRANFAKLACHPLFISLFRLSDLFSENLHGAYSRAPFCLQGGLQMAPRSLQHGLLEPRQWCSRLGPVQILIK